jgi:hypothetical protein
MFGILENKLQVNRYNKQRKPCTIVDENFGLLLGGLQGNGNQEGDKLVI